MIGYKRGVSYRVMIESHVMPEAPKTVYGDILEQLKNHSRGPFQALLARIMDCAPSDDALRALAERSPDRWGQLVSLMSKPSGYTDKLEIEGSISHKINEMSDAQLEAEIQRSQLHQQTSGRESERNPSTTRLLGS